MKDYTIIYEVCLNSGPLAFSRWCGADDIQEAKLKGQNMIESLIVSDGIPRRLLWVEEEEV